MYVCDSIQTVCCDHVADRWDVGYMTYGNAPSTMPCGKTDVQLADNEYDCSGLYGDVQLPVGNKRLQPVESDSAEVEILMRNAMKKYATKKYAAIDGVDPYVKCKKNSRQLVSRECDDDINNF